MHPELQAHPEYFKSEIIKLSDRVYMAFGFAASNVYMIIGDQGVVIVDTTETTSAATNILAEFRKITDLPVHSIILTHSHRDHVSGASVFAAAGEAPEIFASDKFSDDSLFVASAHPLPVKAMQARTKRQFGIGLSYPEEIIGIGVGPGKRPLKGMGAGALSPTKLIGDEGSKVNICGIDLELSMAPGETPDHMIVWLPSEKVLLSGDNFYRSFPNLYAIRGTAYRDFDTWADTMDLLMDFDAEVLGPGHTRPIFGNGNINAVLTDYRDAIRSIVTQTRDGMDLGLTIDQLAHRVKLPKELAEKPHLREYYGRVDFAVRAYFVGTMGWFDGNPTTLNRLAPEVEGKHFINAMGGSDNVYKAAEKAKAAGDYQWALELVDRLIYTGYLLKDSSSLKASILRAYAEGQINCPTRHYYISSAYELDAFD